MTSAFSLPFPYLPGDDPVEGAEFQDRVQQNLDKLALAVGTQTQRIFWGNGTPEAAVTSPVGGLFLRLDGGAATTLYVKESGTGNTGWVGK